MNLDNSYREQNEFGYEIDRWTVILHGGGSCNVLHDPDYPDEDRGRFQHTSSGLTGPESALNG